MYRTKTKRTERVVESKKTWLIGIVENATTKNTKKIYHYCCIPRFDSLENCFFFLFCILLNLLDFNKFWKIKGKDRECENRWKR